MGDQSGNAIVRVSRLLVSSANQSTRFLVSANRAKRVRGWTWHAHRTNLIRKNTSLFVSSLLCRRGGTPYRKNRILLTSCLGWGFRCFPFPSHRSARRKTFAYILSDAYLGLTKICRSVFLNKKAGMVTLWPHETFQFPSHVLVYYYSILRTAPFAPSIASVASPRTDESLKEVHSLCGLTPVPPAQVSRPTR